MSKKEKEEYTAALLRAEAAIALRWTIPEKPDIPIPQEGETTGWMYDHKTRKVYEAWSRLKTHGDMPITKYEQFKGGKALYSTKAKALAGLRHAIEKQAAMALLAIDKMISYDKKV